MLNSNVLFNNVLLYFLLNDNRDYTIKLIKH